ncbi:BJDP [Alphabaculovirus altermyunipunctae]|jgi:DnaJ homolog subfamily C member 17|uniref:BJDP n=1 Tax=Mythimna unipuncta nucleopolyhedrovirus TaxID=447897 RepID=A0A346TPH6_9ABAC|nr:BJDP [Mythimna unipuncta nucleopolyhedrovirus]AXU41486.1 BJDP [Mythimna unipuncta nucleopolyhedrovirus]
MARVFDPNDERMEEDNTETDEAVEPTETDEQVMPDYYTILGVKSDIAQSEIRRTYLKNTLYTHPDRKIRLANNTNITFQDLNDAYNILNLKQSREVYDRFNQQKLEAKLKGKRIEADFKNADRRFNMLTAKFHDLLMNSNEELLKSERNRLQRIVRQIDELERQRLEQEITVAKQDKRKMPRNTALNRVLVRWAVEYDDQAETPMEQFDTVQQLKYRPNGGYDESAIRTCLQKYGTIVGMVMCSNRPGCAIVEFANRKDAQLAIQNEVCEPDNPLVLDWYRDVKQMRVFDKRTVRETEEDENRLRANVAMRRKRQIEEQRHLVERHGAKKEKFML